MKVSYSKGVECGSPSGTRTAALITGMIKVAICKACKWDIVQGSILGMSFEKDPLDSGINGSKQNPPNLTFWNSVGRA